MTIRADLHIHSCLSPCGDLAMSPRAIVAAAIERSLDLIALTDHNTARNVPAFEAACRAAGIVALYGCEVTTSEEVHALALFADAVTAVRFGDEMTASLPDRPSGSRFDDDQVVVDEDEVVVEMLEEPLTAATTFSLSQTGRRIHELGGLFVPAHIDRWAFSVWSQLGFLPPDDYDAVEMIAPPHAAPGSARAAIEPNHGTPRIDPGVYPVVANSDAHYPADVGVRHTEFEAARPGFEALRSALAGGRVRAVAPR